MARGRPRRRSPLTARQNQRRNTRRRRRQMNRASFAIPSRRKYRIDDLPHARNALARVAQNGTPSEKRQVRRAVTRKYPSLRKRTR